MNNIGYGSSEEWVVNSILIKKEGNEFNRNGRDGGAMDAMIKEKSHCDHRVFFHRDHRGLTYNHKK